jgi:hypothetical protein
MKNRGCLLFALLLIIVMFLASCGVGPQCKSASCDDSNDIIDTGVININLLPGAYIQDGAIDLHAETYSVPVVYDWDSDGKKDLLVGYNDPGDVFGYIRFYRNQGTDSSPVFNGYTFIRACNDTCNLSVSALSGF